MKQFLIVLFLLFFVQNAMAAPLDDFVTTWKTDNAGSSNSTSITIPTDGAGYSYNVDWNNDNTFDESGLIGNVTHDFGSAGTYTIRIHGTFPRIYFNNAGDKAKILDVMQWGDIAWESMESAFKGATNLQVSAIDSPNLSNVTSMAAMFYGATAFNSDLSSWDVKVINVTNMSWMFRNATAFNQPLNSWNVSNVTNMFAMFTNTTAFNQDISTWNVSSVTDMASMFGGITLSTANYDALLVGWNALTLQSGVTFSGGNSKYTAGSAAVTARTTMTGTDSWIIIDGGSGTA